jgi:hypothetical protein
MRNVLTITFLILGLIIAVLQLYITATGTHWGEMLSVGGEPEKIDCASLETGQEQCCIDNDYGYWDEFEKQCISDVNESPETEGGGGGE